MEKGCRNMKEFRYEDHVGLWKNELADFMPDRFFDVHEHIGPESVVGPMDEERARSALTNFTFMEWEDLLRVYDQMYAGKEPKYVVGFGFVIHEVDVRAANSYVLHKAKEDPRLLPMLLATPRDPGALQAGYEEMAGNGIASRSAPLFNQLLAHRSRARLSISCLFCSLTPDRILIWFSAKTRSLLFSSMVRITLAAVGAQEPFSINATVRFWKLRLVR